ncbi:hypothetical protein CDD82_1341 [Ophiocordyceps australis]|uniref:magnesium chelatase n=1 Tax=Ophiocordyceps australis TaxID=1399860 RepID=A0A2C5ZQN7_9HYPO|nr:hypothetical protein CDD82_1341 [Ophiocordyceps australis]
MADDGLLDKIYSLGDVQLAVLLCLVSREHGLLSTRAYAIQDLIDELQLVATKTFGLSCVVVDCGPETTLDDFASALLCPPRPSSPPPPLPDPALSTQSESYFVSSPPRLAHASSASPVATAPAHIANCVLARNLDRAPRVVQIQALELLRTRRIFTRTSVQPAPKQFVFLPVLEADSGGQAHLTHHLNDFFCLAHWHDPDDGFPNLDIQDEAADDHVHEAASTHSVVRPARTPAATTQHGPLISESEISQLAQLSQQVQVDVDILRYQMNIVSFLRFHRATAQGMTPAATKHFDKLMRCLAPLHNLDYVTPGLVQLAARKVYLHRIRITTPQQERSMQWGSRLEAVKAILQGVGPEDVIDNVLDEVQVPL